MVQLDDRAANLAHKTAQVRLSDLTAAVSERAFAITVANADVARVSEEQDFVNREYDRTRVLFQRGLGMKPHLTRQSGANWTQPLLCSAPKKHWNAPRPPKDALKSH